MSTDPTSLLATLQTAWLLNGNGPYLWASYGLSLLALAAETWRVHRRQRQALQGPVAAAGWSDEDTTP